MPGSFVGVADYGAFVVAIIVFLLIPGPGNLALITSTGKGGIAGGMGATLGVIAGDQVLLWAAVAGVSAVHGRLSRRPFMRCSGWALSIWPGWVCACCWPSPAAHPFCKSSRATTFGRPC